MSFILFFLVILPQISEFTMVKRVQLHDKTFELSIPQEELHENIRKVAALINKDYEGKHPLILGMLNGAFMFCADLVRELTVPCEINFVKYSSYSGTQSTGKVSEVLGLTMDVSGRDIIVVEDIVETGCTLSSLKERLKEMNVASTSICSMFFKPSCLKTDLNVDYPAMVIPNDFIVGYGLDYNKAGRELKDIYTLVSE